MIFSYKNAKGEEISFDDYPYLMQENDLTDYSWNYEAVDGKNKIKNIRHDVGERNFTVAIVPDFNLPLKDRRYLVKEYLNRLFALFEYDTNNNVNGQIQADTGFYYPCRVIQSDKVLYEEGLSIAKVKFTVVSEENIWIKPVTKTFIGSRANADQTNQDYPFDYLYDYAAGMNGVSVWNLNSYSCSHAKIVIYGAALNPSIHINGHQYIVYTSVAADERLMIDTRYNTVYKVNSTGTMVNCFDLRGKQDSVFQKLPSSPLTVSWNGAFRFDITAFVERSLPEWS